MPVRYLFIACLFVFSQMTFSQYIEKDINYSSRIAEGGNSFAIPVGYSFNNYGPFTVYDKIWVFYTDGQNALWRTKKVGAAGSTWSAPLHIFQSTNSPFFNVAFDGYYFHFIREVNGELKYRRGRAQPDGSIQFNNEVTAYSDSIWKLRSVESADYRHFSIAVDHDGKIWICFKVADGNEKTSNFRPIATSSVADNGSWETRSGFPVFLDRSYDIRGNGRNPNVIEIATGKILFTWASDRGSVNHPEQGMRARLWENGLLGSVEVTGLQRHSATSSLVVPQLGIAMLNSQTEVARRNQNGSWDRVDPTEMNNTLFNVLTEHNGKVRLWDVNGDFIRYKETSDNGTTWGALTEKWGTTGVTLYHMNGTHAYGSQGSHHSIFWSSGTSPYDLHMGIEGTIPHPKPPTLVSPLDGTDNITGEDVTLIWKPVDIAHSYYVQVSTDQNFSSLKVDESVGSDTTMIVTGLDLNVSHYWRVRAVTAGGVESDWSTVWRFGILAIPSAPVLSLPADQASGLQTSITFSWNTTLGAVEYQLQIATVSDFSSTFADISNIQDTEYTINGLDYDRTYYWRVRAGNELGSGDWSQVWSFTTMKVAPEPPILVSPDDGAINVLTSLELTWEESSDTDSYRLQVSKQSDFGSTVVNVGNITNTSYQVSDLEYSTTYYWRVNAIKEGGPGSRSSVWSFTTIIEKPDIPILASPGHTAESVSTLPVLRWDASARAETYRVQLSKDSQFTNIVHDEADIDSTQHTMMDELDEFTTYYWRVNATNFGGTSDWSSVPYFTTGEAYPAAPALVSPADGTTNVTDATLLWNSVPRAISYRVQISKDADFSTIVVDREDISNTFYQATNLEKWTLYYWRVRGIGSSGQRHWSDVWNFETGDIVSVELIDSQVPTEFTLRQNYPNPFNPVTTIQFALPKEANVRLTVYNTLGQHVATIINGEYYSAGVYEATWDARDATSSYVSSGIYIYRITAGDFVETRKMILTK